MTAKTSDVGVASHNIVTISVTAASGHLCGADVVLATAGALFCSARSSMWSWATVANGPSQMEPANCALHWLIL